MILKVKTTDRGGWKFYDRVTEVNHHPASLEKMKNLNCDGRFISDKFGRSEVEEEDKSDPLRERKSISSVIVCIFSQEGFERSEQRMNNQKMIIFNGVAYILNDEGKTIERI